MGWQTSLALLLGLGAVLAYSRKAFGESVIGGLGAEIGDFGSGIRRGISSILSPSIRPEFIPSIGLELPNLGRIGSRVDNPDDVRSGSRSEESKGGLIEPKLPLPTLPLPILPIGNSQRSGSRLADDSDFLPY